MKKDIQNIAILLLFVIAYPYVFQTVHILRHDHGHDHGHGHSHSHKLKALSGHFTEYDRHVSSKSGTPFHGLSDGEYSAGSHYKILQHNDNTGKHCPLCEHDFAKFKIGTIFQITTSGERFALVNYDFHQTPSVLYTGTNTSLRAPPLNN